MAAMVCVATGCATTTATVRYVERAAAADTAAREAVRNEQRLSVANVPMNTIGVSPLSVLSSDTAYASLGYGIAALLVQDLSKSAQLILVERLRIDAVLRELDFTRSGRVDTLTAPRVGKLIGARQVVVGSVDLRTRGTVRLQSFVANTTTGRAGSSLNGSAPLDQIFDAEKSLALRLFGAMGIALTPAERRAVEAHATRSLAAFLEFSRGTRAEAFGDFSRAQAHYAAAARLDANFDAPRARLLVLQPPVVALGPRLPIGPLQRVGSLSTDLINRPGPNTIGTGGDAPTTSRLQLVTFTVIVRTP